MNDINIVLPGEVSSVKSKAKVDSSKWNKSVKAVDFDFEPEPEPEPMEEDLEPIVRNIFKPFDHQKEAFDFIKELDSWALFMEQGTGKSKVVLMKAEEHFNKGQIDRLLVICPTALKNQWQGEVLKDHCPMDYVSIAWDGFSSKRKQGEFKELLNSPKFKVMAINYEAFLPDSKAIFFVKMFLTDAQALVICDESTKIKNPLAKRSQKILGGFKNRPYKGILTGTPTPNSPFDLWSQFNFLKHDHFNMTFHHFKRHYCIMMKKLNEQTGRTFDSPIEEWQWKRCKDLLEFELNENDKLSTLEFERVAVKCDISSVRDVMVINSQSKYSPYKHLDELKNLIDPLTFKVMKEDCLSLPEKVFCKLEVELNAEQKRAIKQLKKDMYTEYKGKELSVKSLLTLTLRLQMITGGVFPYHDIIIDEDGFTEQVTHYTYIKNSPKIKALLDDMETVANDSQIIIWATFVSELELIYKELLAKGEDVRLYYGPTPKNDRIEIEEDFKQNKFRVLVINPALGEFGLNFQNCNLHYFYSNSHRADRRLQAEDRSHRIGQTNKVTYKDIHCLKSIDQKIWSAIKRKEDIINFFRHRTVEQIFEEDY